MSGLTTIEVSEKAAQELGNLKTAMENYAYAPKGNRQHVAWRKVVEAQEALRAALIRSPVNR